MRGKRYARAPSQDCSNAAGIYRTRSVVFCPILFRTIFFHAIFFRRSSARETLHQHRCFEDDQGGCFECCLSNQGQVREDFAGKARRSVRFLARQSIFSIVLTTYFFRTIPAIRAIQRRLSQSRHERRASRLHFMNWAILPARFIFSCEGD